jgi:hypothetical protein
MKIKLFYILNGNNGATYILNTSSWKNIGTSLKFYRARTLKASILKKGLHWYLFFIGSLFQTNLKSDIEIKQYLQKVSATSTSFNINKDCSVLISPTNDKVIVHHHHEYFQKFAFGKSYHNVKKEADIYDLFTKNKKHFQTSNYYDVEDKKNELISFKLSNTNVLTSIEKTTVEGLTLALVAFFKTTDSEKCTVKTYVEHLQSELQQVQNVQTKTQVQVLETIKTNYGELEFPLGLVHRDFKPWNVISYSKPLIFDFEEAVIDGPPLEDLLNFHIDPIIRYKTIEEVYKIALNEVQILNYKNYLKGLNIVMDFKVFLHFYLINRILFWKNANEAETAMSYKKLSNHLILEEKFK